jgi:type II secretory pathway component PulF
LGGLASVGRVHRWIQAAIFAELLRLLVQRNLPFDRALRLAADASDDARLREAASRIALRAIHGGPPADIGERGILPESSELPPLIRVALRHSNDRDLLTSSLRQAATIYRERAIRAADWYAEYLPILLTVGVGGTLTIGFTLLVLWPYASMLHELANWNWE